MKLINGRLEAWRRPLPLGVAGPARSFTAWGCCHFYWDQCVRVTEFPPDYGRLFLVGRSGRPEALTALGCAPRYQYLGVPAPTGALNFTGPEAYGEDCDARSYVYTYINNFGEESAPSPPSAVRSIWDGQVVTVTGFNPPPSGYGIESIRLYRSATGFRTGAEKEQTPGTWYFAVAYLPPETSAYTDDVPLRRLGPPLETEGDRPPPADLKSLVHVNGVGRLAGHAGNRLHFTETHEPWNWPAVYDLTLPLTIKNLGALDNLVFATTEGRPFVIDANTQGLDTPRKVQDCDMAYPDVAQGCYPHQAVVTPFGLVYATTDGLALLKPGATVDIITAPWFSTSEWRKLRPETIRLAWWRGFLLAAT